MEIVQEAGSSAGTTILRVKGPLTLNTLFSFQTAIRQPGLQNLIIDLTDTPYIDSAGLGAILGQWAHCQRNKVKFSLTGISSRIITLLEITKTQDLIPQHKTAEEADASFA